MTRPTRKTGASPIRGSVARIENEHALLINRGSEHHVTEGMIFGVLADDGDKIVDPETGKVIGELPSVKLRVRVTEVHPKYCRAETFEKYQPAPVRMPLGLSVFPDDPEQRARMTEILGASNRDFLKGLGDTGMIDRLSKMAAIEMANPSPRRQQIAGAKKEASKQPPPVRPEVTVNIGDSVEQELS